jgi:hypothetical protein
VQNGFEKLFLVQAVDQAEGGRVQGRQTLVLPPQGGRLVGEAQQGRIALLHPALPGVSFRRGRRHVGLFSVASASSRKGHTLQDPPSNPMVTCPQSTITGIRRSCSE